MPAPNEMSALEPPPSPTRAKPTRIKEAVALLVPILVGMLLSIAIFAKIFSGNNTNTKELDHIARAKRDVRT